MVERGRDEIIITKRFHILFDDLLSAKVAVKKYHKTRAKK